MTNYTNIISAIFNVFNKIIKYYMETYIFIKMVIIYAMYRFILYILFHISTSVSLVLNIHSIIWRNFIYVIMFKQSYVHDTNIEQIFLHDLDSIAITKKCIYSCVLVSSNHQTRTNIKPIGK